MSSEPEVFDEATLLGAADVLLKHGPPLARRLAAGGWDAARLVAQRPHLVAEALRHSPTLREAVNDGRRPEAVTPTEARHSTPVAAGTSAAPPASAADSIDERSAAEAVGQLTELLEHKLHRAEQEVTELRSQLPSRRDRARQRRLRGQLRRAEQQAAELVDTVAALETSSAALAEQLDAVKQERDEALAERDQARRSRAALEARLGDVAARADYLRHLLPVEIERLDSEVGGIGHGKAKTRLHRRADAVRRLLAALDEAYPADHPAAIDKVGGPLGDDTPPPGLGRAPEGTPPAPALPVAPARAPLVRIGPRRDWQVLPLGGAEEIGGSALLVAVAGRRVLIDAGIRPNARARAEMLPRRITELGDRLDAIVVTHAHADHAGYVPALTDRFRSTPIICSPGTAALLPTMWRDSLNVMTSRANADAEWMDAAPQPLYSDADLIVAEERLDVVAFGQTRRFGDLELRLFPAGHVLGAAGVVVSADGGAGGRVVVTGDISDLRQASVAECELPGDDIVRGADLLVIESTYCHEPLPRREEQVAELVNEVRDVVVNGRGRVLIPAFALGRAQEIALILAEHLPEVPVLIDGLARQVSTIYELYGREEAARVTQARVSARERAVAGAVSEDLVPPAHAAPPIEIFSDTVQAVPDRGRFRAVRSFNRGVVITTSGMLTGGPAVQWAKEILPEARDALFLCGYQDEEAPGRRLAELCEQPDSQREVFTLVDSRSGPIQVPVAARVRNYRLSAHADQRGLIDIIDQVAARQVMLVHGLRQNQEHFRQVLRVRGQDTVQTRDWRRGPA